ncbi:MAG: rRNA maturation RNase YbeY [Anaerolineales bacterium]|nr:rRNA maturation RNase YbeY [Anaerolineales bacterium]
MNYQIHVQIDHSTQETFHHLADVAEAALTHENAPPGGLTLVLTSEEHVRDLNRRFADIDETTDVLSFPDGSVDPESGNLYFGDVVIALPVAKIQAQRASHSIQTELALLTVHGVLHLLGHVHDEQEHRQKMWSSQEAILKRMGYEVRAWGDWK